MLKFLAVGLLGLAMPCVVTLLDCMVACLTLGMAEVNPAVLYIVAMCGAWTWVGIACPPVGD